ncbi:MAG: hypothetical protein LBH55_02570 [Mycoplasmataceae bacterium]|jgi:hypothetical protein|nr:hypothetical protein [Mycoplasmataceae bacterium]
MKQDLLKIKKWTKFINNFNYEGYDSLFLKIDDMVYFIGFVGYNIGDGCGNIIEKWDRKEKYAIYSHTFKHYMENNDLLVDEKEWVFYNNWEEMFYNAKINGMFVWEAIIDENSIILEYDM